VEVLRAGQATVTPWIERLGAVHLAPVSYTPAAFS
jgi:hypothetical protein